MRFPLFLLLVSGLLTYVVSQATHTVTVGLEGSFYNPPTVAAGMNDIITFVFAGDIHTVTQGSFANPCLALPGGFNSGLAGKGTNGSAIAPTWDLQVTNVTGPIWFFCEALRPTSHCAAGMVGAINPPSQAMYLQYVNAAKAVSGTPTPSIAVALTGVGAIATNSPAVPSSNGAVSSATNIATPAPSSSTGTQAPTQTSVNSSSPSHNVNLGAIIGASVGGGLGVILIVAILALCLRHQRMLSPNPPSKTGTGMEPTPFYYEAASINNQTGSIPTASYAPRRQGSVGNMSNLAFSATASPPVAQRALSPVRRTVGNSPMPVISDHSMIDQEGSNMSDNASSNNLLMSVPPGVVDVRTLAQEVATVLRSSEKSPPPQRQLFSNHDLNDHSTSSNIAYSASPPNYLLATVGQNSANLNPHF